MTNMSGAPTAWRWRMDSTPRHTTTILSSQKPMKLAHKTTGCVATDGQITSSMA